MQQRTRELLAALEGSDWFSTVGQPVPEPLLNKVVIVSSWAEAVECCASISWENFTLEQRNLLTSYLHDHAQERYQSWNQIVDDAKAALIPMVDRKMEPVIRQHALPEVVGHCVCWDVLGACMESEYADICSPGFFTVLMGWYMKGRFPCGWGRSIGMARSASPRASLMVPTRSPVPLISRSSNHRSGCQREGSSSSEAGGRVRSHFRSRSL